MYCTCSINYQEYIMLGRVSNGPMLAATSTAYCLHPYTFLVYEVYYSQYYHIIRRQNLIIRNYSPGEINHVSKNGCHRPGY